MEKVALFRRWVKDNLPALWVLARSGEAEPVMDCALRRLPDDAPMVEKWTAAAVFALDMGGVAGMPDLTPEEVAYLYEHSDQWQG